MSKLPDLHERKQALDMQRSIIVRAPAGSGKTGLLVMRHLKALSVVNEPEEVLSLTFTNKAANEIRERLQAAIKLAEQPAPKAAHERELWEIACCVQERDKAKEWGLLYNPSRIQAMTLDKFNATVAGQLPISSGMGGLVSITEDPGQIYQEAILTLFAELENNEAPDDLRSALSTLLGFTQNRIDKLIPYLQSLLQTREQWSFNLYADQDKDDDLLNAVVTNRLVHCYHELPDILKQQAAQYFAEAAIAGEEKLAWAANLYTWPMPEADQLIVWRSLAETFLTKEGKLRAKFTKANGFTAKKDYTKGINSLLDDVKDTCNVSNIESLLAEVRALPDSAYPDSLQALRQSFKVALHYLNAYLKLAFVDSGAVDFNEVSIRAVTALGNADDATDVLCRLDYAYRHILVDEMQDTSYIQVELLQKLVSGWQHDDGKTIFMVGDEQQSIYGFRQALVRLFMQVWETGCFGDLPLTKLRLSSNFRSSPAIVNFNNSIFERMFGIQHDLYSGSVSFAESYPATENSVASAVSMHFYSGPAYEEEAAQVAELVSGAVDDNPRQSIAVLVQTRPQLVTILKHLSECDIKYSCQDIESLADSPVVFEMLSLARALWHPMDRVAWVSVLQAPFIGLLYKDIHTICQAAGKEPIISVLNKSENLNLTSDGRQRIRHFMESYNAALSDPNIKDSLVDLVKVIWFSLGGPTCGQEGYKEQARIFLRVLKKHTQGRAIVSLSALLNELSKLHAAPTSGNVQILTMHKSKGLEFDTVIVAGLGRIGRRRDKQLLEYRSLPDGYMLVPSPELPKTDDNPAWRLYEYAGKLAKDNQVNENKRLLYVALTRAKKKLHIVANVAENGATKSNSLLHLLWPAIDNPGQYIEPASVIVEDEVLQPVCTRRLNQRWQKPVVTDSFEMKVDTDLLPSEKLLSELNDERFAHDEIKHRLVGVMYHCIMQRLSESDPVTWFADAGASKKQALGASFRRMGLGSGHIDLAIEDVCELVNRTLNSNIGRWLLERDKVSCSELALSGFIEGKWCSGVIDRVKETDQGEYLLIDYKTGGEAVRAGNVEAFLRHQESKYRPQMDDYERLYRSRVRVDLPVLKALYYPRFDRLLTL